MVLFSELIFDLIEAPTLTTDKQIIYYHRKIVGSHKIVMRYRENPLNIIFSSELGLPFTIYPNPTNGKLNIKTELSYQNIKIIAEIVLNMSIVARIKLKYNLKSSSSKVGYYSYVCREAVNGKYKFTACCN